MGIPGIKTAQYCAGPDLLYYNGFDISDTELMYGDLMCRGCHAAEATTLSLEDERRIRQGPLRPAASSYPRLIAVRRRSHGFPGFNVAYSIAREKRRRDGLQ
jgi:hypothetical protein